MKPISKNATQAIEEALTRLVANPGSGKLTAARLAAEARVSRATLYRARELLQLRALEVADVVEPRTAADRIGEALVVALRGRESDELRELRAANRHMAQHIQALSLLAQDQLRRVVKI
ncbi:MAG: hypothetical protein GEV13_08605 [Rhodospirillales bacterium]|nr:hypothetical protein [Rhodospirillales bacterium]